MALFEAKYNNIKEDDDCTQEALIDPDNDNRKPIWATANSDDDIIKCIGNLRIRYADKQLLSNPPEIMIGTGTIIKIDAQNRCYVLTVAHNACQPLTECMKCHTTTIKSQCEKCDQNTEKLNPIKLVKPTSVEFLSRCTVKERIHKGIKYKFGDPISVHEIDQCYIPTLYNLWWSPMHGYDIAIMTFKLDADKDYIKIYNYNIICSRINLVFDPTFGGAKNRLFIYGYPGDKYYTTDNNLKQYQMYGMSTGMHGNQFQVDKHDKSKKYYIINNEIDTYAGQSGSIVWSYNNNKEKYTVYGIHSGGSQANLKKGRKFGVNYGTVLDKENLNWIESIQNKLCLQSSFNNNQNLMYQRIQNVQEEIEQKLVQELQKKDEQKNQQKQLEDLQFKLKSAEILVKYHKRKEEQIKTEKHELQQRLQTKSDNLKNEQKNFIVLQQQWSTANRKLKTERDKFKTLIINLKQEFNEQADQQEIQQIELEKLNNTLLFMDSRYCKLMEENIKIKLEKKKIAKLNVKLQQKLQTKTDNMNDLQHKLHLVDTATSITEQKMKKQREIIAELRNSSTKQPTIMTFSGCLCVVCMFHKNKYCV